MLFVHNPFRTGDKPPVENLRSDPLSQRVLLAGGWVGEACDRCALPLVYYGRVMRSGALLLMAKRL